VRLSQVLAIAIAVFTQSDVRTSLNQWRDRYQPVAFEGFHHASRGKWILSSVLRFLEGSFGLFVTFLLIMQSETVIDLLLNFTAMEFVSAFDDTAFLIVREGYCGRRNKRLAERVANSEYTLDKSHVLFLKKASRDLFSLLLLAMMLQAMLVGWAVVFKHQLDGRYMCQKVYVQFGDSLAPELAAFSGIYIIDHSVRHNGRPIYKSERYELDKVVFGYCKEEGAWTFTYDGTGTPCDRTVVRSESTTSFDVSVAGKLSWFVFKGQTTIAPFEYFQMHCFDCHLENFCVNGSSCDKITNKCKCESGGYGFRCEFNNACRSMKWEGSDISGVKVGHRRFATQYDLLQDTLSYERPVYVGDAPQDATAQDLIFFNGRRWILSSSTMLFQPSGDSTSLNMSKFICHGQRANRQQYRN
jgi:hypothetical protein